MANKTHSDLQTYRRMLLMARPFWGHVVTLFALSLLATPLTLLGPVPMKIVVDNAIGDRPLPEFLDDGISLSLPSRLPGLSCHSSCLASRCRNRLSIPSLGIEEDRLAIDAAVRLADQQALLLLFTAVERTLRFWIAGRFGHDLLFDQAVEPRSRQATHPRHLSNRDDFFHRLCLFH